MQVLALKGRALVFGAPVALLLGALSLGGCAEVRQVIGAEKTSPDEFQVKVRKPLSMPREYGLRAPRPGAAGPQAEQSRDRARQIILETDRSRVAQRPAQNQLRGVSREEAALLARLGGDKVTTNIRRTVDRESDLIAENNKSFVDALMFWKEEQKPGKVVDPRKEARRIQENVALGRSAKTGKTPVIERKKKGLFANSVFADWF
ncbi:MAG: DUF3035 domain-containing protein [Alphaproteobacteria bacterium]|nr:DUF3035 domain-containing protein [Alphaproteobacteria bacterium]